MLDINVHASMAKTFTAGEIAGIVIACLVGAAGIVLAIVLPLVLGSKQLSPGSSPAKTPASSPASAPANTPASSPGKAPVISNTAAINLWLPTFTAIGPDIAEAYYSKAASFVAAFNNTYGAVSSARPGAKFSGFWVNLADGKESLSALKPAVTTAVVNGIPLGAVMAVGMNPAVPYFTADFDNFNKLNAMYGNNTFTQMAFDVQDILGSGQENALGIATWLAANKSMIPSAVTLVAFTGGPGVTTENIYAEMNGAQYSFQVVGIVELYSELSDDSTVCLPAGSGCQNNSTTVQAVVNNWKSGQCYKQMSIPKALQNQKGTWAGLSVEGQGCSGGCLMSLVDPGSKCDAGGNLSFAQFTLAQFVEILQDFASWSNASPTVPLNIMVYESAFLPGQWLTSLGIT
jgi:hypothetical protein